MYKKYTIQLTDSEREELRVITRSGTNKARVITRARALLLADEGNSHSLVAETCEITEVTMSRLARRFSEGRLPKALYDAPRPGAVSKFSTDDEARITAIACSEAPDGRSRWTLRLLAAKVVELEFTDKVALGTIQAVLKKMRSSRIRRNSGVSAN